MNYERERWENKKKDKKKRYGSVEVVSNVTDNDIFKWYCKVYDRTIKNKTDIDLTKISDKKKVKRITKEVVQELNEKVGGIDISFLGRDLESEVKSFGKERKLEEDFHRHIDEYDKRKNPNRLKDSVTREKVLRAREEEKRKELLKIKNNGR